MERLVPVRGCSAASPMTWVGVASTHIPTVKAASSLASHRSRSGQPPPATSADGLRRLIHRRRRGGFAGTAVLLALAVLLSACQATATPAAAPALPFGRQLNAKLPASLRDAVLVSATGRRLTLAALAGKVVIVSDTMTLCQETCPLDTANVLAAARAVDAAGLTDKVEFLSVTIDPGRDSVARLAAYQKLYAPYPANWLALTGTNAELSAWWKYLGVYIQKVPDTPPAPKDWLTGKPLTYDLSHSDELFFFDTRGTERYFLDGAPHVAAGAPIPATIRHFMDADGEQHLTHPDPGAWTVSQALQVISWLVGHRIGTAGTAATMTRGRRR